MRTLSVGSSDFGSIRRADDIYADKTGLIYELAKTEKQYFLSRPRRFGKTLLLNTIEAVFEGRRELFKGLAIDGTDYDWKPYPVIHLSLDGVGDDTVDDFRINLNRDLKAVALRNGLKIRGSKPGNLMKSLIEGLSCRHKERTGEDLDKNVVVLIDEYEIPILDHSTDDDLARAFRLELKKFYRVLKTHEKYLRFIFITGVTKFSKTSIFSGINNLVDLTLDESYASICGFTIEEFDSLFGEHMEAGLVKLKANGGFHEDAMTADLREAILSMYDGYTWDGKTRLLNPWSVLNCLKRATLSNFWISSGTPGFLFDTIRKSPRAFDLMKESNTLTDEFNAVDVGEFKPVPLMFQTGYLTVESIDYSSRPETYHLRFPNLEVKEALLPLLFSIASPFGNQTLAKRQATLMVESLVRKDAPGFEAAFGSMLADLPFNLHTPVESYYHSLLHWALKLSDLEVQSEPTVGDGKPDILLKMADGEHLIFELKYLRSRKASDWTSMSPESRREALGVAAREAMDQIEEKNYAKNLEAPGSRVCKIALVFGGRTDVMIVFKEG